MVSHRTRFRVSGSAPESCLICHQNMADHRLLDRASDPGSKPSDTRGLRSRLIPNRRVVWMGCLGSAAISAARYLREDRPRSCVLNMSSCKIANSVTQQREHKTFRISRFWTDNGQCRSNPCGRKPAFRKYDIETSRHCSTPRWSKKRSWPRRESRHLVRLRDTARSSMGLKVRLCPYAYTSGATACRLYAIASPATVLTLVRGRAQPEDEG